MTNKQSLLKFLKLKLFAAEMFEVEYFNVEKTFRYTISMHKYSVIEIQSLFSFLFFLSSLFKNYCWESVQVQIDSGQCVIT